MVLNGLIADEAAEKLISDGFASISVSNAICERFAGIFEAAQLFFDSTTAEKLLNRLPLDTGYRPEGLEYSESPDHPDEMETFSVSRRLSDSGARLHSDSARVLHKKMIELFFSLETIVEEVSAAIAAKVTRNSINHQFKGAFSDWSLLQINHSRPALTRGEYINDCHEDGCLLTLTSVTAPGLELRIPDGSFVPVFPTGDELLLMSGDILSLLSGGIVSPAYHRVRPKIDASVRMSLLFFADLDPSLCIPWISNQTNQHIDIGTRVLRNSSRFGLMDWTLEK